MRTRVAAIIKMDGGYALMHRKDVKKRALSEYYTFPGGGLEEGEDLEIGVKREIEEEFGIQVDIVNKLYEEESVEFDQKSYYFLCEYKSGEFGTGTGPEFSNDPKYIDSGKYIPEIVKKEDLENITLVPPDIAKKFIEDVKNNKF